MKHLVWKTKENIKRSEFRKHNTGKHKSPLGDRNLVCSLYGKDHHRRLCQAHPYQCLATMTLLAVGLNDIGDTAVTGPKSSG